MAVVVKGVHPLTQVVRPTAMPLIECQLPRTKRRTLPLGILLYLTAPRNSTWIDNHYRHENRGRNTGSLRRLKAESPGNTKAIPK